MQILTDMSMSLRQAGCKDAGTSPCYLQIQERLMLAGWSGWTDQELRLTAELFKRFGCQDTSFFSLPGDPILKQQGQT